MYTTLLPSQPARIPGRIESLAVTRRTVSMRVSSSPCRLQLGLESAGDLRQNGPQDLSRAFPSRWPRSFASLGAGAGGPFLALPPITAQSFRQSLDQRFRYSLGDVSSSFGYIDRGPSEGPEHGPFYSLLPDPPAPVSDGSPDAGVGGLASLSGSGLSAIT